MAKSRKLEDLTAALNQIRDTPTTDTGTTTLAQVLDSKHAVAIAQAALIIGESELYNFIPDLVKTFNRLMTNGKESDPGCRAKQAIAETLYRLNYSDETLFLQGIHHSQKEPVWGGQVDTASRLRGTCALGLVRMNYPLVLVELGDLLADADPEARIGAARAIAYCGHDQGIPLLRLRIKVGDTLPVISECLLALLQISPVPSLPLVKEVLYARKPPGIEEDVEKAEVAALALAESRVPEAFTLLRDWWQQARNPELRRAGLVAIATLRQTQTLDYLLTLVAEGRPQDAKDAIHALSIYRQDETLWQRVGQTLEQREDASLLQFFQRCG